MSQENLQTMIMQNFGGLREVYYGIGQVVSGCLQVTWLMCVVLTEMLVKCG